MSTRCQIAFYPTKETPIKKADFFIYKHHDGYPHGEHGIVALLTPFLKKFEQFRGLADTEYAMARCAQFIGNSLDKDYKDNGDKEMYCYTGMGITKSIFADIEFFYHVSPGLLQVYAVEWTGEQFDKQKFKLINSISLQEGEKPRLQLISR